MTISPGRVDPGNTAWSSKEPVRKPLAGEFSYDGRPLFVITNHWKSKGGDDPLFGRFQPPTLVTGATDGGGAGGERLRRLDPGR